MINKIQLLPGVDLTVILGVRHWSPPEPQDLNASGPYGFGIPKTDEERFESIDPSALPPWGTLVDVTLKTDGQSISFFWCMKDGVIHTGVGGRTFLYKRECSNNYTRNEAQYKVIDKLGYLCVEHGCIGLCLRGESYGNGIQKKNHNPHSKLPLGLALYSTWLIDERRYARKGEPFYIHDIARELDLPTVPILEQDVPLTPELIVKYSEGLEKLSNGSPFEGVVIQYAGGSFKVINRWYDSK